MDYEEMKEIEIRRPGFVMKRGMTRSVMSDGDRSISLNEFEEFAGEVNDRLRKIHNILHGIKMELGRKSSKVTKHQEKPEINILEGGEK